MSQKIITGKKYRNITTKEVVTVTEVDRKDVNYHKEKAIIAFDQLKSDFVKPIYVFEQSYVLVE